MKLVYIFIPDRIFYGPAACGPLHGHVHCHTNNKTGLTTCEFHISNQHHHSSTDPIVGQILSESAAVAQQLQQPCPDADDTPYFAAFLPHHPDGIEKGMYLQSLKVPGLSGDTRVKIIASATAAPQQPLTSPPHHGSGDAVVDCLLYTHLRSATDVCIRTLNRVGTALPVLRHTAVFQHLLSRCSLLQQPNRVTLSTFALDTVAGLLVTLLLLHIGHPYFHLTHCTEVVVVSVRHLLDALKGFPIGLKLNIQLNNFLLGIFVYHIDLWVTFLVLIDPLLHGMFVPFLVMGALGLSFQLAILSDLLVCISLHAHCFYIYVAVLYHNQLAAIDALWRVLRGLRRNELKARVESHDYTNSQLYLATMFFAAMLFLLPTVLLYYVVFAFLRFCVYCATYVMIAIQRRVLIFPVYAIGKRALNVVRNRSGMELRIDRDIATALPNRVSLTSVVNRDDNTSDKLLDVTQLPHMLSVFQFFMGLVRGHIMGFILPLGKAD